MIYLTKASPLKDEDWVKEHVNEALELLVHNPEFHRLRFDESTCEFDPFKKRVLDGLAKGLSMASIDH